MLHAATIILGISILVTLAILRTPTFLNSRANQIIVIDALTFEILGLCILFAFHNDNPLPLQFGLLVAMLGFLSTIILARFIEPPQS